MSPQNPSERVCFCHERAAEARERAKAIFDSRAKATVVKLERSWLLLARRYELGESLDDFIRTRPAAPASPPCDSQSALISIVDDDESARGGIRALVESFGYDAASFQSAEAFLQSDVVAHTNCLITDLQMPGLNGIELQQVLRSRGYHTPVIIITAHSNERDRRSALDAGTVGFLSKPVDDWSLIEYLVVATQPD